MSDALRIIPLGGLGEVGKNMTLYELGDERILLDAGLAFPRDEHLGVDLVLPDFSYLYDRPLRAIVLTHGHEDHVGALPYVLREVEVGEVVATRLTLGLIKSKLDEHGLGAATELCEADPEGEPLGSARSRCASCAWRTRSPMPWRSSSTPRRAACFTRATGSSTTRRSTG